MRVRFRMVPATEISLVAKQTGDSFAPFEAEAGGTIDMLQVGTHDAASMFAKAQAGNKTMTWILRLAGLVVMTAGLSMVLRPISVASDIIPFFGSIVGAGTTFLAFMVSLVLSLITVAIAWVVYRPLLGVALLLAAVAVAVFLGMRIGKARARRRAAA
jgi:hypothetical protein